MGWSVGKRTSSIWLSEGGERMNHVKRKAARSRYLSKFKARKHYENNKEEINKKGLKK